MVSVFDQIVSKLLKISAPRKNGTIRLERQRVVKIFNELLKNWTKDKVVAEYALRGESRPMGVSQYEIAAAVPDDMRGSLPSIEELEAGLSAKGKDGAECKPAKRTRGTTGR